MIIKHHATVHLPVFRTCSSSTIPSLPPPKIMMSSLIATALWPCLGRGAGPVVEPTRFQLTFATTGSALTLDSIFLSTCDMHTRAHADFRNFSRLIRHKLSRLNTFTISAIRIEFVNVTIPTNCRVGHRTLKRPLQLNYKAMSSQIEALHSSVVACLTAILSGHTHERKPAEDELKALEVTEGEYWL